jgi:hypothetical protein
MVLYPPSAGIALVGEKTHHFRTVQAPVVSAVCTLPHEPDAAPERLRPREIAPSERLHPENETTPTTSTAMARVQILHGKDKPGGVTL